VGTWLFDGHAAPLLLIVGETQAGRQDHYFLDCLYRAAVATHAAMRLRVFMQGEAPVALVEFEVHA
jgi:hypothetical protein